MVNSYEVPSTCPSSHHQDVHNMLVHLFTTVGSPVSGFTNLKMQLLQIDMCGEMQLQQIPLSNLGSASVLKEYLL